MAQLRVYFATNRNHLPDNKLEIFGKTFNPDGVAVLQLAGVMAPKANLFARVSGGISTQVAARQIESAMVDQRVKGMVLVLNSPGGNVLGVPEFAQTIFEAATQKPLVVFSDEQILSAGYWAASAANSIKRHSAKPGWRRPMWIPTWPRKRSQPWGRRA